jgi:hypothetical protein
LTKKGNYENIKLLASLRSDGGVAECFGTDWRNGPESGGDFIGIGIFYNLLNLCHYQAHTEMPVQLE